MIPNIRRILQRLDILEKEVRALKEQLSGADKAAPEKVKIEKEKKGAK